MSVISSAASASAATPIVDLFNHAHKKGGHVASATQGPATNHRLFSSLLESIEQVIGVSLTAPSSAASVTAAAASAAATGVTHSANTLGANVNAKV